MAGHPRRRVCQGLNGMRLIVAFVGLAALFLLPFLFVGDAFERIFSLTGTVAWLREYDRWAWAAGVLLLLSDLILPVPGTVVMSALGFVYGPVIGGAVAALGSFLSGVLGYGLCRLLGLRAAVRILGQQDLARGQRLFADMGGWLVALSRWLPLFPEVVACMAGLTRMRFATFLAALACGSLPLGFAFAAVGHAGAEHPLLALTLSALAPPVLWLSVQSVLRRWSGAQ